MPSHRPFRPLRPSPALAAAVALLVLGGCGGDAIEETSILRGDQAFAQGKYDEALAEYRLAVRQGADDAPSLARVAHTYVLLGRVDDAGTFYAEAAAKDSAWADQAVADLIVLARDARSRRDRFAMATAAETALRLRPGLGISDLALDLARHYFQNGEYGRALPFYQKALSEARTPATADIVFEVGQAYEEIGDCSRALPYFERFRDTARPAQLAEVDWHIGNCSFQLAREARTAAEVTPEELDRALGRLDRMLEVGQPAALMAQAWFERAHILSDLGECSAALESLTRVREVDASSPLAARALAMFDEIRFGQGLASLRGGRCR